MQVLCAPFKMNKVTGILRAPLSCHWSMVLAHPTRLQECPPGLHPSPEMAEVISMQEFRCLQGSFYLD